MHIKVVDDFLDKPLFDDLLLSYEECKMYDAYEYGNRKGSLYYAIQDWIGCYRSDNLIDLHSEVVDVIGEKLGMHDVQLMTFFKHPEKNFPNVFTYGMDIPQHIDRNFKCSGVLYLIGGEGMGTTIGDQYVEWKPNRAVSFDSYALHNPNFGGKDRIVLTFFEKKS